MDAGDKSDPVRKLSVLSTGSVRIRPEHGQRNWKPVPLWLLTSHEWTPPLPINVFVIEHEQGLVLFDAGQDRRSVTDKDYYPGGLAGVVFTRLAEFAIAEDQTLVAQLRTAGYDPAAVTHVVVSHLHQDHMGCVADLPHAELLVSSTEWKAIHAPGAEVNGYLREHIESVGDRWHRIDPVPSADPDLAPFTASYDVFGDGSLVVLPTPGHTTGSISLLVRGSGHAPVLLVGDLTFDAPHFGLDHLPGLGNLRSLRESTTLVEGLARRYPGLAICAAHDPAAAGILDGAVSGG
jgi:glyoxylase-like metal-dependent hydrolase (beta-lactamase superfamily II)